MYAPSDAGNSDLGIDCLMNERKTSDAPPDDATYALRVIPEPVSPPGSVASAGSSRSRASRGSGASLGSVGEFAQERVAFQHTAESAPSSVGDGGESDAGGPGESAAGGPGDEREGGFGPAKGAGPAGVAGGRAGAFSAPPPAPPPAPFRPRQADPPRERPPPAPAPAVSAAHSQSDEKAELLYRLHRMQKRGAQLSRTFTVASPLDDMRLEYDRLVRDRQTDSSVRFQRQAVGMVVTLLERGNSQFNPFDVQLDGWSESFLSDISDYDEVFEELAVKYRGRGKMAPELKLLFGVISSAFMYHVTATYSKQIPGLDVLLKQNPKLMRDLAGAAANSMQDSGADGGSGIGSLFSGLMGAGGGGAGGTSARGAGAGAGDASVARGAQMSGPRQEWTPAPAAEVRAKAAGVLQSLRSPPPQPQPGPARAPPAAENFEIVSDGSSAIASVLSVGSKRSRRTLNL